MKYTQKELRSTHGLFTNILQVREAAKEKERSPHMAVSLQYLHAYKTRRNCHCGGSVLTASAQVPAEVAHLIANALAMEGKTGCLTDKTDPTLLRHH